MLTVILFCLCNCYAVITNVERSSDFEVPGEEGNCRFVMKNVERSFISVVARYIEGNFDCLVADVEGYCGVICSRCLSDRYAHKQL